jgi:hypothetical protein
VFVRKVVGEGEVRAELLKTGLTLGTCAIGVDQTANCSEIASLELGNRGTDLCDTADNLMARHARVNRGHHAAPLIANLMEIGVADAAEENIDLTSCSVGSRRAIVLEASGDVALAAE